MTNVVIFPVKTSPLLAVYEYFECGGQLDQDSWARFCDAVLDKPFAMIYRTGGYGSGECLQVMEMAVPTDAHWSIQRTDPETMIGAGRYIFHLAMRDQNGEHVGSAASAPTMEAAIIRTVLRYCVTVKTGSDALSIASVSG